MLFIMFMIAFAGICVLSIVAMGTALVEIEKQYVREMEDKEREGTI